MSVSLISLSECCTYADGTPMTSPRGDDVAGNGECVEFLLPPGQYVLLSLDEFERGEWLHDEWDRSEAGDCLVVGLRCDSDGKPDLSEED